MRILYLGNFYSWWATEHYVSRGFERLGHEVRGLDVVQVDHAKIVNECRCFKPDVLVFAKAQFRGAHGEWPQAGHAVAKMVYACRPFVGKVVCWLWDLMAEEFSPSRWQWSKIINECVDLYAMTDGYTAPRLSRAVVIRDGCPDDVDESIGWPTEYAGDVLFLGSVYGDRPKLIEALRLKFGPRFCHVTSGVHGRDLTKLVRSYRIVVGPHYPRFDHYWSDRIYVATGHGGLYCGPLIAGMADDGWQGSHNYLATPRDVDGIVEKAAYHVTEARDQDWRDWQDGIRRRGHEHARTHCTWENRIEQMLAALYAKK